MSIYFKHRLLSCISDLAGSDVMANIALPESGNNSERKKKHARTGFASDCPNRNV